MPSNIRFQEKKKRRKHPLIGCLNTTTTTVHRPIRSSEMAGGNRKRFTKAKSRRGPKSSSSRALFVEGGLLSDWSLPFSSPATTRGKNLIDVNGIGKSSTPRPRNRNGSGDVSGFRNGSKKSTGSAIGYVYPSFDSQTFFQGGTPINGNGEGGMNRDERPMILGESNGTPIVAYMDGGSVKGIESTDSANNYNSGSALYDCSQYGLGFSSNMEENPTNFEQTPTGEQSGYPAYGSSDSDEDVINDGFSNGRNTSREILSFTPSPERNPGFLSIGGMKIYTQDIDDGDSDSEESQSEETSNSASGSDAEESSDEENSDSAVSGSSMDSSDCDMFDCGSDIDDEVAADYLEGIKDSDGTIYFDQLLAQTPCASVDFKPSFYETLGKLGGISLEGASREYGKKKPRSRSKSGMEDKRQASAKDAFSSPFDGTMFVKDPRSFSKKKNHVAKISKSWPLEPQKSRRLKNFPGEKKKHRKERIAEKRRDRMLHRGVDLLEINLILQQMVLDGVEIFSFPRMHSRDCSQVRKLATIYRMKSSCLGSGKKRFVTVVRSLDTHMPSPSDMVRIEKFIGAHDEEVGITSSGIKQVKKANGNHVKNASKGVNSSLRNNSSDHSKKKRSGKSVSYVAQPMSFISRGIMDSGALEATTVESTDKASPSDDKKEGVYGSQKYGAFELHTTGFGSKMLAKMGYVEGSGLGKDGQGVAQPVEVFQRPKSLGLGADVPETKGTSARIDAPQPKGPGFASSDSCGTRRNNKASTRREPQQQHLGSFERHTKGFGSKIMSKMGFVDGMGLGKDSQGMVTPLVAVRRPKARGLGAKV